MMLGLQALDDAFDAAEDAQRYGKSVPDRLGVSQMQLVAFSQRATWVAGWVAGRAGFPEYADWLNRRCAQVAAKVGVRP